MRRFALPGLGILAIILAPLWLGEFLASLSVITAIYVVMLVGLSLFLGYGGQYSFAQAVFLNEPASISAWLIVCVPVHTIDPVGARSAGFDGRQAKPSSPVESVTNTLCNVTLPMCWRSTNPNGY